jgi:tetratricopeptide (TPR) repeat protein
LWNYGRILWFNYHDDEARRVFGKIVRMDPVKLATMKPRGGEKWARFLINECKFNIGITYYESRKSDLARKWLYEYITEWIPYESNRWKKKDAQNKLETLKNMEKIKRFLNGKNWAKAQPLLKIEIKKNPCDFWLHTRLAETFYELDKYEKAYEVIKKARKLAPDKPLFMWYYGCILSAVGRKREAISVFKRILRKGEQRIAFRDTTAGIRWARWLMNESRLHLSFCYEDIGNIPMAIIWIRKHINNRRRGIIADYSLSMVRKFLKELENRVA